MSKFISKLIDLIHGVVLGTRDSGMEQVNKGPCPQGD
jgi:hypothetical protein